MTAYTPTHTSGDLSSVVIDFIVEYGVQILAFAGLIALNFVSGIFFLF